MSSPAGNHVVEEYRGRMRTHMKRCDRIHRELSGRSEPYAGLASWPEKDRRWREKNLAKLRELERRLSIPKGKREEWIKGVKDKILKDLLVAADLLKARRESESS
jgi:hypothetical protein